MVPLAKSLTRQEDFKWSDILAFSRDQVLSPFCYEAWAFSRLPGRGVGERTYECQDSAMCTSILVNQFYFCSQAYLLKLWKLKTVKTLEQKTGQFNYFSFFNLTTFQLKLLEAQKGGVRKGQLLYWLPKMVGEQLGKGGGRVCTCSLPVNLSFPGGANCNLILSSPGSTGAEEKQGS